MIDLQLANQLEYVSKVSVLERSADYIKAVIYFTDKSNLRVSIDQERRLYSFYWLNKRNKLIIGWDNRPHHPEIDTFPHHKHVKEQKNIQPSQETDIEQVLRYIKRKIQP